MLIIDGKNCVLGRMSATIAKELIKGETVRIINAEKIIITGSPKATISKYKQRLKLHDPAKPEKSRKTPRRPDLFVKKIVRGMIPYKTSNGLAAYRRLMVYMGVPKEFEGKSIKLAESKSITTDYKYITIDELCKNLGWKG